MQHRCIRLKLYSSEQEPGCPQALVDDEVDFPLQPNGDLDFHRVKLWWGIKLCAVRLDHVSGSYRPPSILSLNKVDPCEFCSIRQRAGVRCAARQALEPYNWKVFRQHDPNKISGIAVHNLSAGRQNQMDLICT